MMGNFNQININSLTTEDVKVKIFVIQDNMNRWANNTYQSFQVYGEYLIPGLAGAIDSNPFAFDEDKDGMPNWFENAYGLDELANNSYLDPDGDGYTNLEEYWMEMNPIINNNPPEPTTNSTSTSKSLTSSTGISKITESITKTAEGFRMVLIKLSILSLIVIRLKRKD